MDIDSVKDAVLDIETTPNGRLLEVKLTLDKYVAKEFLPAADARKLVPGGKLDARARAVIARLQRRLIALMRIDMALSKADA